MPLSDEEKASILADFKEWSGGFMPNECTDEQVDTYLTDALAIDMPLEEARALLYSLQGE